MLTSPVKKATTDEEKPGVEKSLARRLSLLLNGRFESLFSMDNVITIAELVRADQPQFQTFGSKIPAG